MSKCFYCEKTTDLRPYGPKFAMICFKCAMETPEREREAALNFAVQLAEDETPMVLDGSERGPYPLKHFRS